MREVREVDAADLGAIQDWLRREECDGSGFIHNWGLIADAANEGDMLVACLEEEPVAFLTHGISLSSILQVRSDLKGRGIGRMLVEHALVTEEAKNNAVVVVQCAPTTSVSFWGRMGFVAHRERASEAQRSIYMHRLSGRTHLLVHGEDLSLVTVRVYPEERLYRDGERVSPDQVYYVLAQTDEAGRMNLDRRVSIAHEAILGDPVVEISAWGATLFLGKAKHAEARRIGLVATPNYCGWYLDSIHAPHHL